MFNLLFYSLSKDLTNLEKRLTVMGDGDANIEQDLVTGCLEGHDHRGVSSSAFSRTRLPKPRRLRSRGDSEDFF